MNTRTEHGYLHPPRPAIEQRLAHLAAATGRSKAYYLREMVTNGLEDLEAHYLASATMERVDARPVAQASGTAGGLRFGPGRAAVTCPGFELCAGVANGAAVPLALRPLLHVRRWRLRI